jgi:hypothetical protein
MNVFFKANVASIAATFCDYLLTIILKEFVGVYAVAASICGTAFGGLVNFFICRHFVFKSVNSGIFFQSKKYVITWIGNLILNAALLYLLIQFAGFDYKIAKVISSVIVAIAYNYPLQKKYVFKNS